MSESGGAVTKLRVVDAALVQLALRRPQRNLHRDIAPVIATECLRRAQQNCGDAWRAITPRHARRFRLHVRAGHRWKVPRVIEARREKPRHRAVEKSSRAFFFDSA